MTGPRKSQLKIQRSPGEGLNLTLNRRRRRRRRGLRATLVAMVAALLFVGLSPMAGAGPFGGDPCRPADNPAPEAYGSGTDGLIKPPDHPNDKLKATPADKLTYYDRYGTAGQSWYAVDMGCSDAMAMMGNALANTTFTLVRAIDRTTISVYQAAASESLLSWLKTTVDDVISGIGKTFNARYWSWVVILGALWLAWWGLVRKRASKAAEGVIWMIAAMVALIWLIARPADFTTLGTKVSSATSAAFNAALPQSDAKGGTCIPTPDGRPDPSAATEVDATTRNANGLWVALVCKPWLMGEFGTTDPNAKVVKENADKLLWAQAVDLPETYGGQKVDLAKKADAYKQVAGNIKENHAGVYPLFQGKNWTSRLAVAFGALFAALVAGLLIMVIAIALIVVKIAFLLLLVAGPIFLGIGIHPGIGRVIAVRWLELLLSMLLKQAALIGVLSLLLWAYGLILGETLPWGLQILLIALVTFAAFIYRKPFQHLFSAVGYSAVGARDKGEAQLDKSIVEARKSTAAVGAAVVPTATASRLGRWGGKSADTEAAAGREVAAAGAERRAGVGADKGASPEAAPVLAAKPRSAGAVQNRPPRSAPPLNLPTRAGASGAAVGTGKQSGGNGVSAAAAGTGKASGGSSGGVSGGTTGGGTPRPTSWTGRGGDSSGGGGVSGGSGGNGASGGNGRSGGGSSGGSSGGGWLSGARARGRSGGGSAPKPTPPKPIAPPKGGDAPKKDSAGGVPKPRTSGGGAAPGGRPAPPPLWGRRSGGDEPPIPFWLRPVDNPSGERGSGE